MSANRKVPLKIVYTRSEGWWVAEASSIPGAYSQGRMRQSALRNLKSAIRDLTLTYTMFGTELPNI